MNKTADKKLGNWNPWCNSNCLAAILMIEDDVKKRAEGVKKVMRSVDNFIDSYDSDGGCDEGAYIWKNAGGNLIMLLELLYIASKGRINVYG